MIASGMEPLNLDRHPRQFPHKPPHTKRGRRELRTASAVTKPWRIRVEVYRSSCAKIATVIHLTPERRRSTVRAAGDPPHRPKEPSARRSDAMRCLVWHRYSCYWDGPAKRRPLSKAIPTKTSSHQPVAWRIENCQCGHEALEIWVRVCRATCARSATVIRLDLIRHR